MRLTASRPWCHTAGTALLVFLVACSDSSQTGAGDGVGAGAANFDGALADTLAAETVAPLDVTATAPADVTVAAAADVTADVAADATPAHDAGDDASADAVADASADAVGSGPPYPIILAHGFFGFNDFAGAGFLTYFYQVKQILENTGEFLIFTPTVDPFASSDVRSAELLKQVQAILVQTGKAKAVLVGHSQGGLDVRIIAHDHPEIVAAVMMVATPNQGSPVADAVLVLTPGPISKGIVNAMGSLLGGMINPDGSTDNSSIVAALSQFSSKVIPGFNAAYPDAPGIPYWSIAGRSLLAGDGGDCSVTNPPAFVSKWHKNLDPCNAALIALTLAMVGQTNDGLVPVTSAKHGTFLGCIPADHLDEIGQILGQPPGLGNPFDHLVFWTGLVQWLRAQGF